ncbi:M23 family metallopeptidase [Microbacterium sp. CIAB417]|uniref:M23 family metallopeptidase n=1 Tax=Microbacterium sp. CIAB417 TaxID=2860287 RepID=UPI001FAE18B5|nr:M23 family metallopeptidase [Microbacterium sp. CIAB417]
MKKPLRSIAIFGAVGALVAAVALPAYASTTPTTEAATTLQQVAMDDAQSLVVASEATSAPMDRGNYSATTPEEIAQKKAEEAAKARAAAAAKAAASSSPSSYSTAGVALVAPGSGQVRNPVGGSYYVSRTLSGSHNGADMVGDAGTPLYAAAAGTVRISTDSYYGYGVGVVIDHVLGGQQVSTLYGHMIYGSRQVQAGQTVQAGQLIGFMGSTGRSTANHLHFEVRIGGGLVEPIGWLNANGAPA